MIVFLLLVIIAILLFGSGAILHWIGFVIGFFVLVIALSIGASVLAMIPAWTWWTIALVVGGVAIYLLTIEDPKQERLQRELAEVIAEAEEASRRLEALKRGDRHSVLPITGPNIQFHNDGLNKKKRKQLARLDGIDHDARRKLLAPENQQIRRDLLSHRSREDM